MDLSNLKPAKGSINKNSKRVGRGQGSGKGGTATRGHKGAKSRSGYSKKLGFEGGQMPLARRWPRRGFTNIFREKVQIVNIGDLEEIKDNSTIDPVFLENNGYIKSSMRPVKILGNGKISKKIKISASAFSASAKDKIEKAGGETILL